MAQQVDMAPVVEPQGLLGEQQRQFERDAVIPVVRDVVREAEFGFAGDVAPIDLGDLALTVLVEGDPVIVEDGRADGREDGAGGEEDAEAPGPARHRRFPPARSISPSHRLRNPPPPPPAIWPVRTRRMG